MRNTFQEATNGSSPSLFSSEELSAILEIYTNKVIKNEWRDYTIFCRETYTSFVVLDTHPDGFQTDIRNITASLTECGDPIYSTNDDGYNFQTKNFIDCLEKFESGIKQQSYKPKLNIVK